MTYAELFAKDYLGAIFYYCLRKTGNEKEADELASDISLAVLQGLAGGAVPERFSAWVWKIVKNRYARWAAGKRTGRELFDGTDVSEHIDIADEEPDAETALVKREELAALRRELAFIRADYRHVLVSFYIDDKSLPVIAGELGQPLGTVKTRLIKARKILKEGMDMAREFGKLSYRPEQIAFVNNVPKPGRNNEPWSLTRKLLPRNILLAAYRNPMTAEELALELGVALPYLEEEIAVLEKEPLLRKNGKKYETMIYIMSADVQRRLYDKISAVAPAMLGAIKEYLALRDELYAKNNLRWNIGAQPAEDMRWTLLMRAVDVASAYASEFEDDTRTVRPDGGEWDIVGYEEYDGPSFIGVGQHGAYGSSANFKQYKFHYRDLYGKTPEHLKPALADALKAVCEGSAADADSVKELCDMGYLKEENGTYIPQMMAVDARYGDIGTKGLPAADAAALSAKWDAVVAFAKEINRYSVQIITAVMPDYLKALPQIVSLVTDCYFEVRGAVWEAAMADGYISYAENDPRVLLGTSITFGE